MTQTQPPPPVLPPPPPPVLPPPPPPVLQPPPPPPPVLPPAPWKMCPHCRAQAQTLATNCPYCGKGYKKRTVLKLMLALTLTGMAFIVGCSALISGTASQVDKELAATPSKGGGAADSPSKDGPTFENGVLTTSEVKIQVLRHKVIEPGQKGNEYGGKPVIAFWYKTTNLSGGDIHSTEFLYHFKAIQDNNPNAVNELDLGFGFDDPVRDNHLKTIKKGGTVESAVAYELDDLVTPVQLVASDDLFGGVVGKATYKLR